MLSLNSSDGKTTNDDTKSFVNLHCYASIANGRIPILHFRLGRFDWSSSAHPFRGAALAGFREIPIAKEYYLSEREMVK